MDLLIILLLIANLVATTALKFFWSKPEKDAFKASQNNYQAALQAKDTHIELLKSSSAQYLMSEIISLHDANELLFDKTKHLGEEKEKLERAIEELKVKLKEAEENITKEEETIPDTRTTTPWAEELEEVDRRVRSLIPQDFIDSMREMQNNMEKLRVGILSNIVYQDAPDSDSKEAEDQ